MNKFFSNFSKYRYLLYDLTSKDFKTKYRRSVLGVLWSVLNPLLMMIIISTVFSVVFRVEVENYPVYYLVGSVVYNFFSESTSTAMQSILSNGALLKKVYLPKYIFPLEKTLFALINTLFSLIAVVIMFVILQFAPPVTAFMAPVLIIYVFVFSLGVGFILSTICVFFRDIIHLYGVLLTALFYLTPIIFPESMLDKLPHIASVLMRCNPLYYYVTYFRNIVMYGVMPTLKDNLICIGFSLFSLLLGVLILYKKQNRFILYI